MIDEKLFADLVELYNNNIKIYKEKNTGLIIDYIKPLEKETVEKEFSHVKEIINRDYITKHFISFTVNPQVTEMIIKNGVTHIELSPDISWEREIHND